MKPSQVNKLYSKLTPYEQAALSFEAASRQNENELHAIVASVEKHTYQSIHADYRQRATGLFMLVGEYGIHYWKSRALMMTALNLSNDDDNMDFVDIIKQFLAKLASMDAALANVCIQFKVDVESVKTLVGCKGEPTFDQYAEAGLIEEYTKLFKSTVNFQ